MFYIEIFETDNPSIESIKSHYTQGYTDFEVMEMYTDHKVIYNRNKNISIGSRVKLQNPSASFRWMNGDYIVTKINGNTITMLSESKPELGEKCTGVLNEHLYLLTNG